MTEYEDDDIIINAEYSEQKLPKKEPGVLGKFASYVKKNRAAEAERRKKTGEPSFSEELSKFGSDWGKNLTKGMADVGKEEESKLNGKSGSTKIVRDDDTFADEILFGKKNGQPVEKSRGKGDSRSPVYTEKEFIDKLCEFLRYTEEDDNVSLWQRRGEDGKKEFQKVDNVLLGRLLSRYLGHKVTIKERDLSIK